MNHSEFNLYQLFRETHQVRMSVEEIAHHYGVSIERAKEYIRHDVEVGVIIELRSHSTYYLSFEGLRVMYQILSPQQL